MGTHITKINKDHLIPTRYIPQVHNFYNSLLKTVVAGYGQAYLVEFPDIAFDESLMMHDGIHPNEQGYKIIADRLAKKIAQTSE